MNKVNLLLLHHPKEVDPADFHRIAKRIKDIDRHIVVRVHDTNYRNWFTSLALMLRPTVVVAFTRPARFVLLRGMRLSQLSNSKVRTYPVLAAARLPLPEYVVVEPDTRLDPAYWGPYVVVKPDRGQRGAFVRIRKAGRVRYEPPESFPKNHPGRRGPMIVQRFVHTGRWPISYRVLTLFGEPLLSTRYDGRTHLPPVGSVGAFRAVGGASIVASAKGGRISLCGDRELYDLARRVHAAFPTVPLLGTDFIRDSATGQPYIVETNANGWVWMFSNAHGRAMQAEFGFDFYKQLDGLERAAEVLARVARQHAR